MNDLSHPTKKQIRARLDDQLGRIEDVQDLEFVELVAALPDQPFSEELAVEVFLEVARYVERAKVRHERAVEKLRRAQPEGRRPT